MKSESLVTNKSAVGTADFVARDLKQGARSRGQGEKSSSLMTNKSAVGTADFVARDFNP